MSIIPEFSAQSKFQFIDAPLQQMPHKCAACFRYDDPEWERNGHLKFVDFNCEFEFYGKLFICTDCLREMCNQLGWATEDQVKRANDTILGLIEQVSALSVENENLRDAVGNLSVVAADRVISNIDRARGMVDFEVADERPGEVAGDSSSDGEPAVRANEEPDGPANEPGPSDVFDDDSLTELLKDL